MNWWPVQISLQHIDAYIILMEMPFLGTWGVARGEGKQEVITEVGAWTKREGTVR